MSKDTVPNLLQAVPNVDERLAAIEAQLASSWALRTRTEYEADVRSRMKSELLSYVTTLVVSAFVLLGSAGYIFLRSAIVDVYHTENDKIIGDLRAKYDTDVLQQHTDFEWKRYDDYGKNYVYLAEFYSNSGVTDERKAELLRKQFSRAKIYFTYAIRTDPRQASTYWELGELYYSYPKEYGLPEWVDINRALNYYEEGSKLFSEAEVSRGWRGDTYRMIGRLKLEQAKALRKEDDISRLVSSAQEYLVRSRDDYVHAIPESREYNSQHAVEVDELLISLSKDKNSWRAIGSVNPSPGATLSPIK